MKELIKDIEETYKKFDIDDIVKHDVCFQCKTYEKALDLKKKLENIGYSTIEMRSYDTYDDQTCYSFTKDKSTNFSNREYYINEHYLIIAWKKIYSLIARGITR